MVVVSRALTLYNWGIVVVLLGFQFLIARFYEKKSRQRSYYLLFLIPMVLFLVVAVRYAFCVGDVAGDVWADGLLFVGGGILAALSAFLFRLMMGGRQ